MFLELYDNEKENSLVANVKDINYLYQAEQWIEETLDQTQIVRWELKDQKGGTTIAKWERPEGSVGYPKKVA
jgi:hypothetical protein